jgi:acetyl esterase/lipase
MKLTFAVFAARRIVYLLSLLIMLTLAGCQATFMRSLKAPYLFSAYQKTSHAYGSDAQQVLDVYRPTAKAFQGKKLPVIVFFFGGSWRNGERAWYEFFAAHYALKGYVVVLPDYRKAPQNLFPDFMTDAARSVAFTRAHVGEWQGDVAQMFLMGHSAGAHMAALLCLDQRYLRAENLQPSVFKGFIGLSGPYDFLPMTDPLVIEVFNGDANLPASQPIQFAQSGSQAPPMLLIHGNDDQLVWPKNSRNLAERVNAAGGKAQVVVLAKTGHVKTLFQAGRGLRWLAPEVDTLVLTFLRETGADAHDPAVSKPVTQ